MNLKIEFKVGDLLETHIYEGTKEEVLFVAKGLIDTKDNQTTVVNSVTINPDIKAQFEQVFVNAYSPGGLLAK